MPADPTLDSTPAARPPLVLASASPRRADLLRAAGFAFEVIPADVDESQRPGEEAPAYVWRVAQNKAETIAVTGERRAILAADTVVIIGEQMLGKPVDRVDAKRMLEALSGRTHTVMTCATLLVPAAADEAPDEVRQGTWRVCTTLVEFAAMSAAEMEWYVSSGEPMGKAGAYAIQGLASRFVTRIDGSYSNVVGLPIAAVHQMCRQLGILLS